MTKKKLTIIFLLIFSLVSVFGSAQTVQASLGNTLLKLGSTGSSVVQVQTELNYLGYNVGAADGIFGTKTKTGVINFQKANALSPDGIVGPKTGNVLSNAYAAKLTSQKANAIIATAKKYIGTPYAWGGVSPSTGFDCSGFVKYVFAQNGITLPRVSTQQYSAGKAVSFYSLQPGDLVFFSTAQNGTIDHVGIYIGKGQFINAATSKGVTIYSFGSYWNSVYMGARRVL